MTHDSKDGELEMTPMIDVTFLLLIFFMCTLKFKTLESRLAAYLPDDGGLSSDPAEPQEALDVGIHVVFPGTKLAPGGEAWSGEVGTRYEFDVDRVVNYSVGPRGGLSLGELKSRLANVDMSAYPRGVVLAAGTDTVQREAVGVIDLLMESGIDKVLIQGAK